MTNGDKIKAIGISMTVRIETITHSYAFLISLAPA